MVKNKKVTIKPKNKDNKCFQYAARLVLNYQIIKNNSERLTKIHPFIDQYNWKEIDFSSNKNDWKNFQKIIKQ